MTVTTSFVHASGDLDLELYASDGTLTSSSAGTADTESVTGTAGRSDDSFYVRVFGYGGATNTYAVTVSLSGC